VVGKNKKRGLQVAANGDLEQVHYYEVERERERTTE
jgi:hypothetical protein